MLLYNIQIVVVVAKDKNAVVASHTAKRIGICSCFPDLSTCRTVKAIAIAAAHAAVGVEVDLVCAGAVAHDHDGALHREVIRICNCDNRGHRMGRCIHAENAALVDAGVCADIDPVANLGRGGRGGCTQCNVPFIRRNAILTLRVAPEEAALAGKVQVGSVSHDGGADVAGSSSIGCGQRYRATSIFEVCNAAIVEHTIVAAEVDIVANLDCACPVEAGSVVISFRSIFCIADINLIIGAACAARPGTEVEVIAILDNRSVNLAVNTSHHIRDRR